MAAAMRNLLLRDGQLVPKRHSSDDDLPEDTGDDIL